MGKLFYPGWFAQVLRFTCFLSNDAGMLPGTCTQKNKEKNKTAAYTQG
jgi:hypothetical protein